MHAVHHRQPSHVILVGERTVAHDGIIDALRRAECDVTEASFEGVVVDGLSSIALLIVDASTSPREAMRFIEIVRRTDDELPIVVLATEEIYFDVWPNTAELGVLACFSLPADLRWFSAIISELIGLRRSELDS